MESLVVGIPTKTFGGDKGMASLALGRIVLETVEPVN